MGTAAAKDQWFVLSEQTIKATDPSVRITAEDAHWIEEDVEDVRLSEAGAETRRKLIVITHGPAGVWGLTDAVPDVQPTTGAIARLDGAAALRGRPASPGGAIRHGGCALTP